MRDKNHPYHIDITPELIKKYMQGQLDGKTMHAIERQALDDPFLSEALEGYALREPDQAAHLDDLHRRLSVRIENKKPEEWKLWFLKYRYGQLAAAAILLLLIGIGVFFFIPRNKLANDKLVITDTHTLLPNINDSARSSQGVAAADSPATPDIAVNIPKQSTPRIQRENKLIPLQKQEEHKAMRENKIDTVDGLAYAAPQKKAQLSASAAVVTPSDSKSFSLAKARMMPLGSGVRAMENSRPSITGNVKDATTGNPLDGVTVSIPGTANSTVSDSLGNFMISLPPAQKQISFAYIGYAGQNITPVHGEQNLEVSMHPDNSALNEVVVADNIEKKQYEAIYKNKAQPIGGFAAFRRYVRDSLRYPAEARAKHTEGTVKLSFWVLPDSTVQQISVVNDPGNGCAAEGIRLLKEGPQWYPLNKGDTAWQEIDIKFNLEK